MLSAKPITKLVFLDIETKAISESYEALPAKLKLLFSQQWAWKIDEVAHRYYIDAKKKDGDPVTSYAKAHEEVWKEKGHLSPEYAQIICISAGMIMDDYSFRCASFTGETDKEILTAFLANKKSFIHQSDFSNNDKYIVCYNGLGFDIPFLSKRILYNSLELPPTLDCGHLKPWEMGHIIDLKNSLKFGGFDAPSLEALCTILDVETAQDKFKAEASELAGKHKDKQYDVIKHYCEQDVFALAQCYLKLIRSKEHPSGNNNKLTKI
jgi:hypothetical protein